MTKLPENDHYNTRNNSTKKLLEASQNIVFIDPKVIDYQNLIAGITLGSEVVILDPNRDGLTQITEFLAQRKSNSVQSIHIVSHGSAGSLQLGSSNLNLTNLNSYTNQLKKWVNALTDNADILIYGCDVASGEGIKFVQQISQMTGADVAASTNKTGSEALGGDWNLEVNTGKIEASLAFDSEVTKAYKSILPVVPGAVSITSTYSQNFDSLSKSGTSIPWANDSTIAGWYATRTTYDPSTGSNSVGGLYSFGTSASAADRALGSVASGTTGTIYYGLRLLNNTGLPITKLEVGYTGEQWRNGGNISQQKLNFSYQTGSTLTSLTTGTWTPVTSLDFTGPIATANSATLNGNTSANRVVITPVIFNLATPIANGEEIILRWEDINDGGNNHGLAIDDVSVQIDSTTYIVTNTNDSGAGSLRQAIINANNDPGIETIIFDTTGIFGDATPDTITLTSGQLNVTEGVIIQGTGANKLAISGNNASRVFNASASLSIDGLNITGGNAGNSFGGGIYSTSSVTVSNSTISGNVTNTSGGGIYGTSSVIVSNSTISGNTANTSGGGIYGTSSATVSDSTISGNIVNTSGGGIYTSNATITNSTLSGNTASNGGGIYGTSSATVSDSTVSGNIANTSGGGIYSSNATITNSTVSGNTANTNGGGIYGSSSATVSNSTVSGNIATSGGGIYSSITTLTNSTISSNTAKNNGGGIYSGGGTVSNSTIFANTADSDNNNTGNGGGIYRSAGTWSISNSIIAGNIDPGNQGADVYGNNFNGNAYNLIGKIAGKLSGTLGMATGTDIINPNPGLKPLGNYGGSTQTHALDFNSPARNAGDPTYSGGLTTDQRGTGFNRIENGRVDIGAFEYMLPKVSFGAATYNTTEDSTATIVTIPVTLNTSPETAVIVPIVIKSSSTATSGNDYTFSPTTISFAAGATGSNLTQLITFTINPDDLPENVETVVLNFGTPTGANLGTITETTLNIAANDSIKYAISTATSTLTEGNSGTQAVTFTVTRSGGIGVASAINYAFSGAAIFGSDYNNIQVTNGGTASSGTLNFAVGETTKTITADVLSDNTFELNEDITVTLSNPNLTTAPENSTITNSSATVSIINDDNQPTISISDVSVTEGNTGTTTNANFTITLSNPSFQQVSVNYNTNDGTANVADSDYNSGLGTITFNPGETSKTLSIGVIGDQKFESDETFSVNLSGATNATFADDLGVGTIINDEKQATISISDVSVTEGNTGTTTNANFNVTLSDPSNQQVTVEYNTSDDTAKVSDSDYNSAHGTIVFNPGETSKIISVGVIGDNKFENNERFAVNLFNPTNSTITDSLGVATILNDDQQPRQPYISISDAFVNEGTTGMFNNAKFFVTLTGSSSQIIIVNYSTSDGTAKVSDHDYNSALGTVIFAPGETSKTISIGVNGDNKVEANETFFVNLYGAANAIFTNNQGVGIIKNDDSNFL